MKIQDAFRNVLNSYNVSARKPIFETYDKNVQGNTVHERGKVAASMCTPFRNFPELSDKKSKTAVAVATGGNPNLAKISAKEAARSAVSEGFIAVSCVGGNPLCATDCLNFGNPEKPDQMGEFVDGVTGVKEACEYLDIPIVSGNVSLYNESGGTSIPPSALISVFASVENPKRVPQLSFKEEGLSIFCIGARSENLGGSELLNVHQKKDTRIPMVNLEEIKDWSTKLQKTVQENEISTAHPLKIGGLISAIAQATFENEIGCDIEVPDTWIDKIPQFLFSEDLGVLVATKTPQRIKDVFGANAFFLGRTKNVFNLKISTPKGAFIDENLKDIKKDWNQKLRGIF